MSAIGNPWAFFEGFCRLTAPTAPA